MSGVTAVICGGCSASPVRCGPMAMLSVVAEAQLTSVRRRFNAAAVNDA